MTRYLRGEMGFNGLISTDATPMIGFCSSSSRRELVPGCIESGADVILFNRDMDEDLMYMKAGIADGRLSRDRLEDAVTRILATKAALHLPEKKSKVFSGEVKFTNEEMSKLVQASVEHRSDVLAQILHPEALEVLESASAEFEPEKAEPVPMPTPQTEEFRCYHVPDEFMKVYKSLSRATEMMKNSWKKTLKNNPSYFTDPEKQKVLRFAMQRPANYLTEIETYLEKALAEALEEEKTA